MLAIIFTAHHGHPAGIDTPPRVDIYNDFPTVAIHVLRYLMPFIQIVRHLSVFLHSGHFFDCPFQILELVMQAFV